MIEVPFDLVIDTRWRSIGRILRRQHRNLLHVWRLGSVRIALRKLV